jgi:hypothetical protein
MLAFAQKQNPSRQQASPSAARPATNPAERHPHVIQNLQRSIGNQAVLRLLESQAASGIDSGATAETHATGLHSNLSAASPHPAPPLTLQAKLTVNTPGDVYEQEADRVAEQVMRMPEPQVQRTCACGGSCDDCQKKQESPQLQMKSVSGTHPGQTEAPPSVHEVLHQPGRPLDAATRAFMEPRFGRDFSGIRVHTGPAAAQSTRDVNARAYTVGHNIVMGDGQPSTSLREGRNLLAHELTHVLQQSTGNVHGIQRQPLHKPDSPPQADDKADDKEISKQLDTVEAKWRKIASLAKDQPLSKTWVTSGDEVVKLIRAHSMAARNAMNQKDPSLFQQYLSVLKTDFITYQYVLWDAFFYQNLSRLDGWVDKIADSMKHDARAFTGRKQAEKDIANLLHLRDSWKKGEGDRLTLVLTNISFNLHPQSGADVPVTLTSGADKARGPEMQRATAKAIEAEQDLEVLTMDVNAFLEVAFNEGLDQAADAVEQYYNVKSMIDGLKGQMQEKEEQGTEPENKQENRQEKKEQRTDPTPHPYPFPVPDTGDDDGKKRKCNVEEVDPSFGRVPCHSDFAKTFSGTRREFLVTDPNGLAVQFDAKRGSIVYEVKTGYGWVLNPRLSPDMQRRRTQVIERFQAQAQAQLLIALKCGLELDWYFNSRAVAEYFNPLLEPPVKWKAFDCDQDSDHTW